MGVLDAVTAWPVDHVAAAVVVPAGVHLPTGVASIGDPSHEFRLASLSKPMAAWAVMIAVQEGIVELDAPPRLTDVPPGATLRHLLAHAAGYGFDGADPVTGVERRRIYSNTGIERAAAEVAAAAAMPFADYLREAVFEPLAMAHAELRGSPAHGVWADLDDMIRWLGEMLRPRLIDASMHAQVVSPQYPALAGIVPGVGRFDPCPWGLGVEIRGDKSPHWSGRANSPATFGHFGGSGTMMWVDPVIDTGLVALTDRPFDEWSDVALRCWPELSDAVVNDRSQAR
jgi:CubicO group peptidase (beta-lactamase class C family)